MTTWIPRRKARNTDPETSHEAARRMVGKKANAQKRLLLAAWAEVRDANAWEAMERADGVSPRSEYATRASDLYRDGLIEKTGEKRLGAAGMEREVYRITDRGRAVLAVLANNG